MSHPLAVTFVHDTPVETDADGYRLSGVLGRWYRLDRDRNAAGRLVYDLRER